MAGAGCVLAAGCVPIPTGFDSPEPAARIDAAVKAAGDEDLSSVPGLITMLESDDPASRLVAIRALERLTSETMGYDHAASEGEREEAVARWVAWWGERSGSTGALP